MSVPDGLRASVLIADFLNVDAGGKLHAIGLGTNIWALMPHGGTAPMYVGVVIDAPQKLAGQQISMSLELRDLTTDSVATAPGPTGQLDAIRVQQLLTVEKPTVPGFHLSERLHCRLQAVMGFSSGLPVTPGHIYGWTLEIENTRRKGWVAEFYVLTPPQGPLFGGPAGPSDIPSVSNPTAVEEDE